MAYEIWNWEYEAYWSTEMSSYGPQKPVTNRARADPKVSTLPVPSVHWRRDEARVRSRVHRIRWQSNKSKASKRRPRTWRWQCPSPGWPWARPTDEPSVVHIGSGCFSSAQLVHSSPDGAGFNLLGAVLLRTVKFGRGRNVDCARLRHFKTSMRRPYKGRVTVARVQTHRTVRHVTLYPFYVHLAAEVDDYYEVLHWSHRLALGDDDQFLWKIDTRCYRYCLPNGRHLVRIFHGELGTVLCARCFLT